MKKILSVCVLLSFMLFTFLPVGIYDAAAQTAGATYRYVSPEGSDDTGDGTEGKPWKTMHKAAQMAQPGDTVLFADGTYNETQLTVFVNSGEQDAPITFKSENKYGAKIVYEKSNNSKLQIGTVIEDVRYPKEYINIEDFEFTQTAPADEAEAEKTSDVLIRVIGKHCKISGNKISNVYEDGIKLSAAYDVVIENNIVTGAKHEGIDAVNASDCVIRGNQIIDCGRIGVLLKGNSRNCSVYNNLVKNTTVTMTDGGHGFNVGGSTTIADNTTLGDYAENTGFEAYNCVFYNNIVYGNGGKIINGFRFTGAKDCYAYNNVVTGTTNGFCFATSNGIAEGWGWDVPNVNPVVKNNIIMNVTNAYLNKTTDMDCDYNLFYNISGGVIPQETSSIEADPMFADAASDWSIPAASPAAGKGVTLPVSIPRYTALDTHSGITTDATEVSIEHKDFTGAARKTPWDIGAYNRGKVKTTELLSEDFEKGTIGTDLEGWNGWALASGWSSSHVLDSKFTIKQEAESNKAASLQRTRIPGSDSMLYRIEKKLESSVSDGMVSVQFRVRRTNASAVYFTFLVQDPNNKRVEFTFNFSNGNVTASGVSTVTLPDRKISTSSELARSDWYDLEFLFDLTNNTVRCFESGVPLGAASAFPTTSFNGTIEDILFATSRNGNVGVTEANFEFFVDDIYVASPGEMEVVSMSPTKDDNLVTAEIVFSNNIKQGTLTKDDIVVNNGAVPVKSVTMLPKSKRACLVTFNSALELETEYNVKISGVEDTYGNSLEPADLVYKTRDRVQSVSEIKFYKDYGTVNEDDLTQLADGEVTAAIDVLNEKKENFNAALIMVHKRGGKIMAVKAADASVTKETLSPVAKSVKMTLSGVTADDSVEVYLWDSLQGMKPIGDAKTITTTDIQTMALEDSAEISALTLNASISGATASSGTMKVEGTVTPAQNGMVTAYVLKPGYELSALTVANFEQAVDFAGQKAAGTDGSYAFTYTMQGAVNDTVYNAYTGGNNIAEPEDCSVTFYGEDFINRVVTAVNNATAAQISQMLAGSIDVPNVTPSVKLNKVLNPDLSVYNTLNDYGDYEKYKTAVAETLEAITFTGTEQIRTELSAAAAQQKTNQDNYISLLSDINNSLWSNLAQKFQEDKADKNMIKLSWDGSYASIKHDTTLLEKLYKALEPISFGNFNDLRYSFEYEASLLKPAQPTTDTDTGYGGGGGGGGGGVKYSPDLAQNSVTEPIAPETEEAEKVTFNDLDSVDWAKEAILYLAQNEIVNGVEKGKFAPNDFVTREQFVKMAVLAMQLHNEDAFTEQFIDAPKREWYNSYIANAVEHGIVYGIDDEHFGVGLEITRAEMAAIVYRAALSTGKTLAGGEGCAPYADNDTIPDYARECVMALGEEGIMNGVGNGMFAPREKATRAMAAKVIYLLMGVN